MNPHRPFSIIAVLLFCVMIGTLPAQEQSDYEVKQSYDKAYRALMKQIEAATTVQECADISVSIDALEKEYKSYQSFLDKALYPDNLAKQIEGARIRLTYAQTKLGIIQDQVTKIAELESQVRELTDKVEKLTNENSALLKDVQVLRAAKATDQKAIDSLNAMIAQLRQNIVDRDRMIFAMVDSIFLQYDKNVESLADVAKQRLSAHLDRNNVLSSVKRSINDNVLFLESTRLSGKDLAAIVGEQKRFANKWKGLGPKLASLYVAKKDRAREIALVDTMIAEWGAKADREIWNSLNQVFTKRNLTVKPFSSSSEFYANVMAYLEDEAKNVYQRSDDERYATYKTFADSAWGGEIVRAWMPMLTEGGMLNESQMAEVQSKIEAWQASVQPPKTMMYAIIAVVMVALLVYLSMRMKKKTQGVAVPPKP